MSASLSLIAAMGRSYSGSKYLWERPQRRMAMAAV